MARSPPVVGPATLRLVHGPIGPTHIGGAATAVSLVVHDGGITWICAILKPHKLGWPERWRNYDSDRAGSITGSFINATALHL